MLENTTVYDRRFAENLSAIAAVFHLDPRYRKFYAAIAGQAGFVEIWMYMIDAAEQFRVAELELKAEWDGEWIDAIDMFVDSLLEENRIVTKEELKNLAWDSVDDRLDRQDDMKNEEPA